MKKLLILFLLTGIVFAAAPTIPTVNLSLSAPSSPKQLVTTLNVMLLLTLLVLALAKIRKVCIFAS